MKTIRPNPFKNVLPLYQVGYTLEGHHKTIVVRASSQFEAWRQACKELNQEAGVHTPLKID